MPASPSGRAVATAVGRPINITSEDLAVRAVQSAIAGRLGGVRNYAKLLDAIAEIDFGPTDTSGPKVGIFAKERLTAAALAGAEE